MAFEPTSELSISRALNTLLERDYWVPGLKGNQGYTRQQDDTDGSNAEIHDLTVFIDFQGDVWLPRHGDLRFRTGSGGGASLRVRKALVVLAEAIRRDNEERPRRRVTDGVPDLSTVASKPVTGTPE